MDKDVMDAVSVAAVDLDSFGMSYPYHIRLSERGESISLEDKMQLTSNTVRGRQFEIMRYLGLDELPTEGQRTILEYDHFSNILKERIDEYQRIVRSEVIQDKPIITANVLKGPEAEWLYEDELRHASKAKWMRALEEIVKNLDVILIINEGPKRWTKERKSYPENWQDPLSDVKVQRTAHEEILSIYEHLESLSDKKATLVKLGNHENNYADFLALLYLAKQSGGVLVDVQTASSHVADWLDVPEVLLSNERFERFLHPRENLRLLMLLAVDGHGRFLSHDQQLTRFAEDVVLKIRSLIGARLATRRPKPILENFPELDLETWRKIDGAFVHIDFINDKTGVISMGSGFVLDEHQDYYFIVTAAHVPIDTSHTDGEKMFIRFARQDELSLRFANGQTTTGAVIGVHWTAKSDIGFILVNKKNVKARITPLLALSRELESQGLGKPYSRKNFVGKRGSAKKQAFIIRRTDGVSGTARVEIGGARRLERSSRLELDMDIKSGDSGAPVFDANGHLIGVLHRVIKIDEPGGYAVDLTSIKKFLSESIVYQVSKIFEDERSFVRRFENANKRIKRMVDIAQQQPERLAKQNDQLKRLGSELPLLLKEANDIRSRSQKLITPLSKLFDGVKSKLKIKTKLQETLENLTKISEAYDQSINFIKDGMKVVEILSNEIDENELGARLAGDKIHLEEGDGEALEKTLSELFAESVWRYPFVSLNRFLFETEKLVANANDISQLGFSENQAMARVVSMALAVQSNNPFHSDFAGKPDMSANEILSGRYRVSTGYEEGEFSWVRRTFGGGGEGLFLTLKIDTLRELKRRPDLTRKTVEVKMPEYGLQITIGSALNPKQTYLRHFNMDVLSTRVFDSDEHPAAFNLGVILNASEWDLAGFVDDLKEFMTLEMENLQLDEGFMNITQFNDFQEHLIGHYEEFTGSRLAVAPNVAKFHKWLETNQRRYVSNMTLGDLARRFDMKEDSMVRLLRVYLISTRIRTPSEVIDRKILGAIKRLSSNVNRPFNQKIIAKEAGISEDLLSQRKKGDIARVINWFTLTTAADLRLLEVMAAIDSKKHKKINANIIAKMSPYSPQTVYPHLTDNHHKE